VHARRAVPTADQCRQRCDRGDLRRYVIGKDGRRIEERAALGPGRPVRPQPADAGRGTYEGAVPHPATPRPVGTEGAAFRQHDVRVERPQFVEGQAERIQRARLEVGEHRVGRGDQTAEHRGTARVA
jgi:hypothetical protein